MIPTFISAFLHSPEKVHQVTADIGNVKNTDVTISVHYGNLCSGQCSMRFETRLLWFELPSQFKVSRNSHVSASESSEIDLRTVVQSS